MQAAPNGGPQIVWVLGSPSEECVAPLGATQAVYHSTDSSGVLNLVVHLRSQFQQISQETKSSLLSLWHTQYWESSFHYGRAEEFCLPLASFVSQQPQVGTGG